MKFQTEILRKGHGDMLRLKRVRGAVHIDTGRTGNMSTYICAWRGPTDRAKIRKMNVFQVIIYLCRAATNNWVYGKHWTDTLSYYHGNNEAAVSSLTVERNEKPLLFYFDSLQLLFLWLWAQKTEKLNKKKIWLFWVWVRLMRLTLLHLDITRLSFPRFNAKSS